MALYNIVCAVTNTLGISDVVIGAAVSGYKSFADVPNGAVVSYGIRERANASGAVLQSEVGTGTWNSATLTLARTVTDSTNAGSKIILATGYAEVYITPLAADFHNPVTIDTANGLSLATQALSLGLASAGVTGALSGTDWSTFNAKQPAGAYLTSVVADSPLSGAGTAASHLVVDLSGRQPLDADLTAIAALGFTSTAFLKKTAADTWALDTATYEPTITILPASKGGTGIANGASATLTLPNLAITIAGGVAGGTYTLPSTAGGGTFPLLATANVFTENQTISNTAPSLTLTDTTASAKSLTIALDGNLVQIRESADAANARLVVDLANVRVGIGTQPFSALDVAGNGSFRLGTPRTTNTNKTGQISLITYAGNTIFTMLAAQSTSTNNIIQYGGGFGGVRATTQLQFWTAADNVTDVGSERMRIDSVGNLGLGVTAPLVRAHIRGDTTTTNAVLEVQRIEAIVSTAATGGANGFGIGQSFFAETATDGTYQQQGLISTSWIDSTNASRKADLKLYAYDTAARLGLTIEASGSAAKVALYSGTPVVRGAALTVADASAVNSGDATTDTVINNMRTRINELEARLGSATGVNIFA